MTYYKVCLEEAELQLEGVAGLDLPIILSFEGAMRTLDRECRLHCTVKTKLIYL